MKKRKNIIISLDDFGIDTASNKLFLKLLETGKIDRIGIMPNGFITLEESQKLLTSKVALDIHLDMLDNIKPEREIKEGFLMRSLMFVFGYIIGTLSAKKIEKLWEKQLGDFQKIFGKFPDGINSHQHIHFFPPYFKKAIKLSKKHQIKFIRSGKEFTREIHPIPAILNTLRLVNINSNKKDSFSTSNIMTSFDWIRNFEKFEESLDPNKKIELIFHPERREEFEFLKKYLA